MTKKVKTKKPKAAKPKAAAKPKGSAKPATSNEQPATGYRQMQRELSAKIRAAKTPLERLQLRRAYAAAIKQARIQSVRNAYPVKAAA